MPVDATRARRSRGGACPDRVRRRAPPDGQLRGASGAGRDGARRRFEPIAEGEQLIVEAGTGVGKSLAYLVPSALHAVRNNARTVVSTNTINLQDQLIASGHPDRAAILASRRAHVRRPARRAAQGTRATTSACCAGPLRDMRRSLTADEARVLVRMLFWLGRTETGDRAELNLRRDEEPRGGASARRTAAASHAVSVRPRWLVLPASRARSAPKRRTCSSSTTRCCFRTSPPAGTCCRSTSTSSSMRRTTSRTRRRASSGSPRGEPELTRLARRRARARVTRPRGWARRHCPYRDPCRRSRPSARRRGCRRWPVRLSQSVVARSRRMPRVLPHAAVVRTTARARAAASTTSAS